MSVTPNLLVVGHVTRDLFGAESRLGGSAAFAAQAGVMLGFPTALVTAAPDDAPLLAPLHELEGLALSVVSSRAMTTFAVDYVASGRRLTLRERACDLSYSDIEASFKEAQVAYLAPVAAEVDLDLAQQLDRSYVIVSLQGFLRGRGALGVVKPEIHPALFHPPKGLRVATFSELDHPDSAQIAEELARRGVFVALTRAARGATLLFQDAAGTEHTLCQLEIPPVPAIERDPTGAGDVFGLVLGLSLWAGLSPVDAGYRAALAGARTVEGPGLGNLSDALARLRIPHGS